jgi:hypothetical protein
VGERVEIRKERTGGGLPEGKKVNERGGKGMAKSGGSNNEQRNETRIRTINGQSFWS